MSLLIDLFQAFTVGVVVFLFGGPLIAALLPWDYAQKIISTYHSIAMSLLGRAIGMKLQHGGFKLKKSRYNPEIGAEEIRIGRHKKHYRDPKDYMTTFKGYPFGLAHQDRRVIVDARTAYIARLFIQLVSENDLMRGDRIKAYFAIDPEKRELINLDDIKAIIQMKASPGLPDRAQDQAEKSQIGYNTKKMAQQGALFIALGVGAGLMWLLSEAQSSTGGSSGPVFELFIGVPF